MSDPFTAELDLPSEPSVSQETAHSGVYAFVEPLELAQILMPSVQFHAWQEKISADFGAAKSTQHDPYKLCLCACNGSGKDAFVIAPFVVWFLTTRKNGLVVVTSSSGVQLTAQTETYISRMCTSFNATFGREAFKVNKRHITCLDTGSECRLFATDEPGKAEGYHPIEPGAEMAVIINECKSVPDDILQALTRCTGYNFWLEVSTPGEPRGHFYQSWKLYKNKIRVTSFDCPHKAASEIEEDKLRFGENSALFRSKHLALFTQFGGQFVVAMHKIETCREKCKTQLGLKWELRAAIDVALSNGGDETVCYIAQGNKVIAELFLRSEDVTVVAKEIGHFLRQHKVPLSSTTIFIDDGGVGRAVWPLLQAQGFTGVQRVLNQFRAFNPGEFANRGAELWFNGMRFIEENLLLLPDDQLLIDQITERKYERSETSGKIRLESKADAKAEGRGSPDRADAYFLLWHGLCVQDFHESLERGDTMTTTGAHALTSKELIIPSRHRGESLEDFERFIAGTESEEPQVGITATIRSLFRGR